LVGYGAVEEFDRAVASFGIVENESFDYYGARIALTEGASIEVQHAAARRRITRAEELFVLEPKDGAGTFGTMEYADGIAKHLHAGGSILALMLVEGVSLLLFFTERMPCVCFILVGAIRIMGASCEDGVIFKFVTSR